MLRAMIWNAIIRAGHLVTWMLQSEEGGYLQRDFQRVPPTIRSFDPFICASIMIWSYPGISELDQAWHSYQVIPRALFRHGLCTSSRVVFPSPSSTSLSDLSSSPGKHSFHAPMKDTFTNIFVTCAFGRQFTHGSLATSTINLKPYCSFPMLPTVLSCILWFLGALLVSGQMQNWYICLLQFQPKY